MTNPIPNRRWLRFSLRTLFVAMTVWACWLGYYAVWHARRNAILHSDQLVISSLVLDDAVRLPWPLGMLGAKSLNTGIILPNETTDKELSRVQRLFPETIVRRW